jgi:hypothetical protein
MNEVLQLLIPHAVLLAVLGFLGRSIYTHWLNKDIERFKDQLRAAQESHARNLEHALEIARLEHQVRFSRLYEKRFSKIEELHTESRQLVSALADSLRVDAATSEERIHEAERSVLVLHQKLKLYEIFLPAAFVAEWDQELSNTYMAVVRLGSARADPHRPLQPALRESVDAIAATIRRLNSQLADRARSIIEQS